jgi:acyl dehydratase
MKDGAVFVVSRVALTAEAIEEFAAAYDPQPQHLNDEAARLTPLQGQAASGWHTCALLMQQLQRQLERWSLYVEVPTFGDIRWLRPVRPNDILETTIRWRSKCGLPGCQSSGGWLVTIEVTNQAGEHVLRMNGNALIANDLSSVDVIRSRALGCARRLIRAPRTVRRAGGHLVRYFEEVELGDEIALGSYDFTEAAMRSYTNIIDRLCEPSAPSPRVSRVLHADRVNSWHLIAAWMRGIVDYYQDECDWLQKRQQPIPILGPAAGVRSLSWCGPVNEGERITFTSWAEHKVNFGTSSGWGLLVAGAEGVNQNGDVVVSFYPQFLLQKQPT